MDWPYTVNPSEEVVREEVAIDVILWCNEYALALAEGNEAAAAAAVNLMGKHLAKRILEARCHPSRPSSSPYSSDSAHPTTPKPSAQQAQEPKLSHSHEPDTGRKVGLVLTDSSAASPVGIQSLRTVARQHAAYFNCSDCQRGFPQSSNMSVELATWMLDTLAHLAGHWRTLTTMDGTE